MIPILMLAIGLLLIFLEFYLPGAVLGIAGGILIIFSIIFFAIYAQDPIWLIFFILISIILVIGLVKFAIWRIRKAKPGRSIYLHQDQAGYTASSFQKQFIGKKGVALSDLKPSGHILVEGQTFQAVSKTGYIFKGSQIEIVGGEGSHLIVKFIATHQ